MHDADTLPAGTPIVITASDIPPMPPCCQLAHERGYRRGYRDGYTYGFWDAGKALSGAVWERFWHCREQTLLAWVHRAYASPGPREGGPRFDAQRKKGGAA
jgi:hypothetical protein